MKPRLHHVVLETSAPPPNIKPWTAGSDKALEKLVHACLMPAMPIYFRQLRALDKKSMQNKHSQYTEVHSNVKNGTAWKTT